MALFSFFEENWGNTRESDPQGKLNMLSRVRTGSRRQSGCPSVYQQQPDQDSNLEPLVRSET